MSDGSFSISWQFCKSAILRCRRSRISSRYLQKLPERWLQPWSLVDTIYNTGDGKPLFGSPLTNQYDGMSHKSFEHCFCVYLHVYMCISDAYHGAWAKQSLAYLAAKSFSECFSWIERRKKSQKARLLWVLFDLIDLLALFGVYAGIIFVWTFAARVFFWDSRNLRVPHVSSPSSPQVCLGCAELSPEFRCSGCRVARFCSKAEGRRWSRRDDDWNGWCSLNWWSNKIFLGTPPFWWSKGFLGTPHFETFFKYSWLIKVDPNSVFTCTTSCRPASSVWQSNISLSVWGLRFGSVRTQSNR